MFVSKKRCRGVRWQALLILNLLASACQPGIIPSAAPSPQVIALQSSSTLRPILPILKTCIAEQPGSAIVIKEVTPAALNPVGEEIGLRWGSDTQPSGFTSVIGQEALAVIVHPDNPIDQISLADLRDIFAGSLKDWQGKEPVKPIQPWAYPTGDDIQAIITSILLQGSQPARRVTSIAPDPAAMLEAISTSPTAIGFIPHRWLTRQVKEIAITGIDSTSLRQPILALTQSEPQGLEKEWLLCVQDKLGEE